MPDETNPTWDSAAQPTTDVQDGGQPVVETSADLTPPLEAADTQTRDAAPSDDSAREVKPAEQAEPLQDEVRQAKDGEGFTPKDFREKLEVIKHLEPYAEVGRIYLDPTKSAKDVNDHIYNLSPTRYNEIANDILESHWEDGLKLKYGKTDAEIRAALETPPPQAAQPTLSDSEQLDYARQILADESGTFSAQDKAMAQQFLADQELKAKVPKLEERLNTFETKEQERDRVQRESQAAEISNGLYDAVWEKSVVVGLKDKGLEINEKDSEEVQGLKLGLSYLLTGEVWPTFDKDDDNKKAVSRAKEFADRLEKDNALREEDGLVVRGRSALETVWESDAAKKMRAALTFIVNAQAQNLAQRGQRDPLINAHPSAGQLGQQRPTTWAQAEAG